MFSAGADIKAFTQMDESSGGELIDSGHALLRDLGQARVATIAAVNSIAFGGGCELAMACDFRIAARVGRSSASPRSSWASSPASAAPSACRGWSARTRRWR